MSSFHDLVNLSLFLFVLWFAQCLSSLLWLGILGEIIVGVLFVPVWHFLPEIDALTLLGSIGIALLVIEGNYKYILIFWFSFFNKIHHLLLANVISKAICYR